MLQSPAPALMRMAPPLSGPSMKARSLMVPSCMLNSRSGPAKHTHTHTHAHTHYHTINLSHAPTLSSSPSSFSFSLFSHSVCLLVHLIVPPPPSFRPSQAVFPDVFCLHPNCSYSRSVHGCDTPQK